MASELKYPSERKVLDKLNELKISSTDVGKLRLVSTEMQRSFNIVGTMYINFAKYVSVDDWISMIRLENEGFKEKEFHFKFLLQSKPSDEPEVTVRAKI